MYPGTIVKCQGEDIVLVRTLHDLEMDRMNLTAQQGADRIWWFAATTMGNPKIIMVYPVNDDYFGTVSWAGALLVP